MNVAFPGGCAEEEELAIRGPLHKGQLRVWEE